MTREWSESNHVVSAIKGISSRTFSLPERLTSVNPVRAFSPSIGARARARSGSSREPAAARQSSGANHGGERKRRDPIWLVWTCDFFSPHSERSWQRAQARKWSGLGANSSKCRLASGSGLLAPQRSSRERSRLQQRPPAREDSAWNPWRLLRPCGNGFIGSRRRTYVCRRHAASQARRLRAR